MAKNTAAAKCLLPYLASKCVFKKYGDLNFPSMSELLLAYNTRLAKAKTVKTL